MTKTYQMFIGGRWIDSSSGDVLPSINPADESTLWLIQRGNREDVESAVTAAQSAFNGEVWKSYCYKDRADLLREIGDLILENAVRLSQIETSENGKPIKESSLIDIPEAAETFKVFASMVLQLKGESFPTDGSTYSYTIYEPLGVVGAIIPWNYPLLMAAWKIAPALAAGNCIVIKPSEYTSATLLELAKLLDQTSLPAGVINIVTGTGDEVGEALSSHPLVQKVSFTGSTVTGKKVLHNCSDQITQTTMELGGKSATILMDDAHLPSALPGILCSIFMNQGQMCTAGSRLMIHTSIYDEVTCWLQEKLQTFTIGNGNNPTTDMGPLISLQHLSKVKNMVQNAVDAGATLLFGYDNVSLPESGYFFAPTILSDVAPQNPIWHEEVFGPVLIVDSFTTTEEAINKANDSRYGLALSIWSSNHYKIQEVSRAVNAGTVWVNTYGSFSNEVPFGGFMQSGFGKDLGLDSLLSHCRKKTVTMDISCDKTPLVSRWYGV